MSSGARSWVRVGLLCGLAAYALGAALLVWSILRSPSSTAAIGLLFVPFLALAPGAIGFALGASGAVLRAWLREPERRFGLAEGVAIVAWLGIVGGGGWLALDRSALLREVQTVRALDRDGLTRYLAQGARRHDRFVLNAIAQHPRADTAVLDAIARREDPALHESLGALFAPLGENRRGLAVMRLVARHPEVSSATLVHLARSDNAYVRGDVAGNPRTPEAELRRLHGEDGYLIEWGLARNPEAPPDLLHTLVASDNEYTRSSVAANPNTSASDLATLARDPVWHVRRSLAMNPRVPPALLAALAEDPDERVQRQVAATRERARRRKSE